MAMASAKGAQTTWRLASSELVPLTSFQASHLARASSFTAHGWEPCRQQGQRCFQGPEVGAAARDTETLTFCA